MHDWLNQVSLLLLLLLNLVALEVGVENRSMLTGEQTMMVVMHTVEENTATHILDYSKLICKIISAGVLYYVVNPTFTGAGLSLSEFAVSSFREASCGELTRLITQASSPRTPS